RHTRSDRDWSSDVCSSDLGNGPNTDTHGIWRIPRLGTPELFAALPAEGFPNALAWAHDGSLLVSDSGLGVIWRIAADRSVTKWRSEERRVGKECRTGCAAE